VIARTWHCVVPKSKSEEYKDYLDKTGVTDYQKVQGNCGIFIFRRDEKDKTHYLLLSLWESLESIREFAGEDLEKARYYPEDMDYIIEFKPYVAHYEVLIKP
jgi:heme-degrading monooxygenase HmoA